MEKSAPSSARGERRVGGVGSCRRHAGLVAALTLALTMGRDVNAFATPRKGFLQRAHAKTAPSVRGFLRAPPSLSAAQQPVDQLADDDLVALPFDGYMSSIDTSSKAAVKGDEEELDPLQLRLCVVRSQSNVYPLIRHEDDVETDLFLDPRHVDRKISVGDIIDWWSRTSSEREGVPYYGVGWYGQRPVPSLGGGPGYGAEADEVWSVDEDVLERLMSGEGGGSVDVPVIDVGMAHGEKARGGALF